jgi:hypothetical protein
VNLKQLATRAAVEASRIRARYGIGLSDAVCPFNLAERMGLSVRLIALPSLEGIYTQEPGPAIIVSTERPAGRRRYTCGHEIGHHVFHHGMCLDELFSKEPDTWSEQEFVAHRFSTALLMPKIAVEAAFARRGWLVTSPCSVTVYVVAGDLGVGYSTLIQHLERTLKCISADTASRLRKATLAQLRSRLAGFSVQHDLFVADEQWGTRPLELEAGDIALIPATARFRGGCATLRQGPNTHILAIAPGRGILALEQDRLIDVQVSRRGFSGLARYRYLEEPTDAD